MKLRTIRQRRWRARKGQVAAVATILGLLLVVSFIANYLATVLPGQMEVNELSHITLVENQISRLQAIAYAESTNGRTGLPLTQPVTLGSAGQPPFGQADNGALTRGATGANLSMTYQAGATVYSPPSFGTNGGVPSSCSFTTSTQISCGFYAGCLVYNFTGGSATYSATAGSGSTCLRMGFTTNSSTISVTEGGGGNGNSATIIGSSNTITLNPGGGASTSNLTVVGNSNTITVTCASGSNVVNLLIAGNSNLVLETCGGTTPGVVHIFGQSDTYNLTVNQGGSHFAVQFAGYSSTTPTCPFQNQSSTDKVGLFSGWNTNGNTLNTSFLNSVGYHHTHTTNGWTNYSNSQSIACPFWSVQAITSTSYFASGIVAHLNNAYVAAADVAYEEGAVIYAQAGGIPVMLGGPEIHLTSTTTGAPQVSLWMPEFTANFTSETGIETASLVLKLVSVTQISLPTSNSESTLVAPVSLTLTTVYAPAWLSYFNAIPSLYPNGATCTGPGCTGVYNPQNGVSTVSVTLVDDAALTIQLALFSVTFQ